MLDHIGLQAKDVEASLAFYLRDPDGHHVEGVHHG
jgi:catechol 2,3-dioxygenase-like lactoylglutathione lyase family enzyme